MTKNGRFAFLSLAALSLFIASCANANDPLARFVPSDALAVLRISSPETALTDFDAFAKKSGVDAIMGGQNAKSFLSRIVESASLSIDDFDLSKQIVVAALKPLSPDEKLCYVFVAAFKGDKARFEKAQALAADSSPLKLDLIDGWIVMIADQGKRKFPVDKGFDSARIPAASPGAASIYIDLVGVKTAYPQAALAIAMLPQLMEKQKPSGSDANRTSMAAIGKLVADVVSQSRDVSSRISLDSEGVSMTFSTSFLNDMPVTKILAKAKAGSGVIGEIGALNQNSAISFSWDLDPAPFTPDIETLVKSLYSKEETGSKASLLLLKLIATMGAKGSAEIDLSAQGSHEALDAETAPDDMIDSINDAITIWISSISESKADPTQALKEYFLSDEYTSLVTSLMPPEMAGMKFKYEASKGGPFPYHSLIPVLTGDDTTPDFSKSKLTIRYAYQNGKLYMCYGEPQVLFDLVSGKARRELLSKKSEYASFTAFAPKDAQFAGFANLGRFLSLIKDLHLNDELINANLSSLSGFFWYGRVSGSSIEFGAQVGALELSQWLTLFIMQSIAFR